MMVNIKETFESYGKQIKDLQNLRYELAEFLYNKAVTHRNAMVSGGIDIKRPPCAISIVDIEVSEEQLTITDAFCSTWTMPLFYVNAEDGSDECVKFLNNVSKQAKEQFEADNAKLVEENESHERTLLKELMEKYSEKG